LLLDDVESDMSAFHRVDDIRQLPGPRFIRFAERLPHYSGAVRATLVRMSEAEPAKEEQAVITAAEAATLPTLPGMPALFEFSGA
jgi:hypothetical protein